MSTTATTSASSVSTWTNLLISLGASLGSSFTTSPVIQNLIGISATAAENLVTILGNRGTASTQSIAAPIFLTVLQAAIAVLEAEGKLPADESAALSKAITDTFAADAAAQKLIDPSLLKPIAPLP